jgi:hypothetical protein
LKKKIKEAEKRVPAKMKKKWAPGLLLIEQGEK